MRFKWREFLLYIALACLILENCSVLGENRSLSLHSEGNVFKNDNQNLDHEGEPDGDANEGTVARVRADIHIAIDSNVPNTRDLHKTATFAIHDAPPDAVNDGYIKNTTTHLAKNISSAPGNKTHTKRSPKVGRKSKDDNGEVAGKQPDDETDIDDEPDDETDTDDEQPDDETDTDDKQPDDVTDTDDKQPDDVTDTDNEQPDDDKTTDNEQPDDDTTTDDEQPDDDKTTDDEQPDDDTITDDEQPDDETDTDNEQPDDDTTTDDEQPDDDKTTDDEQPDDDTITDDEQPDDETQSIDDNNSSTGKLGNGKVKQKAEINQETFQEISEELSEVLQLSADTAHRKTGHGLLNETVSGVFHEKDNGTVKRRLFNIIISGEELIRNADENATALSLKLPVSKSTFIQLKRARVGDDLFQVSVDDRPSVPDVDADDGLFDKSMSTGNSSGWPEKVGDTFHISDTLSVALMKLIGQILNENNVVIPDVILPGVSSRDDVMPDIIDPAEVVSGVAKPDEIINSEDVISVVQKIQAEHPLDQLKHQAQIRPPKHPEVVNERKANKDGRLVKMDGLIVIADSSLTDDNSGVRSSPKKSLLRSGGAIWSEWMEWDACSQTCGSSSRRRRTRYCVALEGLKCQGSHVDIEACADLPSCVDHQTIKLMRQDISDKLIKDKQLLVKVEKDLNNPETGKDGADSVVGQNLTVDRQLLKTIGKHLNNLEKTEKLISEEEQIRQKLFDKLKTKQNRLNTDGHQREDVKQELSDTLTKEKKLLTKIEHNVNNANTKEDISGALHSELLLPIPSDDVKIKDKLTKDKKLLKKVEHDLSNAGVGEGASDVAVELSLTKDRQSLRKVEQDLNELEADILSQELLIPINANKQHKGWSNWGVWGSCSKTCGDGITTRQRKCNRESCVGSFLDEKPCNIKPCLTKVNGRHKEKMFAGIKQVISDQIDQLQLVHDAHMMGVNGTDSVWMTWGTWTGCSVACGDGVQTRMRACLVDAALDECHGIHKQTRICQMLPCSEPERDQDDDVPISLPPVPKDNDESMKLVGRNSAPLRTKPVFTNNNTAKTEEMAAVSGAWSEWSKWGDCSVTCGMGQEVRLRTCEEKMARNGHKNSTTVLSSHCPGYSHISRRCIRDTCLSRNIDKVKKLPEGKYAKLYCLYADRTSTDNITWVTPSDIVITDTDHFQGRYVLHSNYLYIEHAEDFDQGTYHCVIKRKHSDQVETGDATLVVMTCLDKDNPCNGGHCIENEPTLDEPFRHFKCLCPAEYSGSFCQKKVSRGGMISLMLLSLLLFIAVALLLFQRVAKRATKRPDVKKINWKWPDAKTILASKMHSTQGLPSAYSSAQVAEPMYTEIVNEVAPESEPVQDTAASSSDSSGEEDDEPPETVSRGVQSMEAGLFDALHPNASHTAEHQRAHTYNPEVGAPTSGNSTYQRFYDRGASVRDVDRGASVRDVVEPYYQQAQEMANNSLYQTFVEMETPGIGSGASSTPRGSERVSVYRKRSEPYTPPTPAKTADRRTESDSEWATEYEELDTVSPRRPLLTEDSIARRYVTEKDVQLVHNLPEPTQPTAGEIADVDPAVRALQPRVSGTSVRNTLKSLRRAQDSPRRNTRPISELEEIYQSRGLDNMNQNNSVPAGPLTLEHYMQDTAAYQYSNGNDTDADIDADAHLYTGPKLSSDNIPPLDLSSDSSDDETSDSSTMSSSSDSEVDDFEDISQQVKADIDSDFGAVIGSL